MNTIAKIALLVFGLIALVSAAFLFADEANEVSKVEVPGAVMSAFQKSYPDAKVSGYDKEVVDGKTYFEIETMTDKLEKTYVYLDDATLLQIEEEILAKSLPEIVLASINKAHPNCEIDEADKITRGTTVEYELVVEVGDKEMELLVAVDGQILTSAQVEDEDDDSEEDGDEGTEDDEDEDTNEDEGEEDDDK